MDRYDLCLAWNWQYDTDFVDVLDMTCQSQGVSLLQVSPTNLAQALEALVEDRLQFDSFFDRASDVDENFNPLVAWANRQAGLFINRFRLARRAWNKAAMHQKFLDAGLEAPETLVIPSFMEEPDLPPPDLSHLGGCFAIKPVHGGGGKGVIVPATCWDQVLAARQEYPDDTYLLQAYVEPAILEGRPGWFRIISCMGQVFPFWWDPRSHVYTPLVETEMACFGLDPLWEIPARVARICRLELFSTEIVYTPGGRFLIVDYVNDPIDLRPQSKTPEGVPDETLRAIARELVSFVYSSRPVLPAFTRLAAFSSHNLR